MKPDQPPTSPIDRDVADAFAALDRAVDAGAADDLADRVLARVGDEPPDGAAAAPPAPGAELDTSPLQRIGAEKLRDVAMRGGTRLPALGRLVAVASVVVGDGVAQRARRQAADLAAWATGRMLARARGAHPLLRGGRKDR